MRSILFLALFGFVAIAMIQARPDEEVANEVAKPDEESVNPEVNPEEEPAQKPEQSDDGKPKEDPLGQVKPDLKLPKKVVEDIKKKIDDIKKQIEEARNSVIKRVKILPGGRP